MILLTDEEIEKVLVVAQKHKWEHRAHPRFEIDKELLEAQLKKMVEVLKDKTIKAWGGNRVILSEDWKAIIKEVE